MKVLILTCSTGGGHNTAAAAIGAYFEKWALRTTL